MSDFSSSSFPGKNCITLPKYVHGLDNSLNVEETEQKNLKIFFASVCFLPKFSLAEWKYILQRMKATDRKTEAVSHAVGSTDATASNTPLSHRQPSPFVPPPESFPAKTSLQENYILPTTTPPMLTKLK